MAIFESCSDGLVFTLNMLDYFKILNFYVLHCSILIPQPQISWLDESKDFWLHQIQIHCVSRPCISILDVAKNCIQIQLMKPQFQLCWSCWDIKKFDVEVKIKTPDLFFKNLKATSRFLMFPWLRYFKMLLNFIVTCIV